MMQTCQKMLLDQFSPSDCIFSGSVLWEGITQHMVLCRKGL